jgi:hypothetical protein
MTGMYGLWSLARESWMFDPMSDSDPPEPLRFENIMDAITKAATYHFAFLIVPIRFNQQGEPNKNDLAQLED